VVKLRHRVIMTSFITSMQRQEIERIENALGDPASYMPVPGDKADLIKWAILSGNEPVAVHAMSFVDLVNLYHGQGGVQSTDAPTPSADAIQRATARAVIETMSILSGGTITEGAIRALAFDEMQKFVDALPPRRVEIIAPTGIVMLEGMMHYRTEIVIKTVSLAHATMLVGPAGCGKTTIGEHVALALSLPFKITNTINDTHELIGFVDGLGKYHGTPFRSAFEYGGVWIADEIDAWDASALLAANSALANGYCTFPDREEPVMRHPNFRMIATANTFGTGADRVYVGRNELDAASLDRFATINVDYDTSLERMFAGNHTRWLDRVWSVRKSVNDKKIRHVVSSRAISMGAAALSIGIEWKDVEEIYLFKGMSERDREKIND
jgi:hypothetical protein